MTPFKVVYGRKPPSLCYSFWVKVEAVAQDLQDRDEALLFEV